MRRFITLSAAALCVVTLAGCAADKSLYSHGTEVISEIHALAENEDYTAAMLGMSDEIVTIAESVADCDYSEPSAVLRLTLDDDFADDYFDIDADIEEMQEMFADRIYAAVPARINSTGGVNVLAASSVYTGSKLFVAEEKNGSAIYLYAYEDAYPAIVVFNQGDDGATCASGSFLLLEELRGLDADELCDSISDIMHGSVELTEITE